MKSVVQPKSDTRSATITQTLALMVIFSTLLAVTANAVDPAWWSSPGTGSKGAVVLPQVVTNGGVVTTNYIPNVNAVVTKGQLKHFTVRAVDELNAVLTNSGGAGLALNTLASNWATDYTTNGYNATNMEPSDRMVMTVGQLKYIASLVYGQLSAGGYSGLTPSWLAPNTNSDSTVATLGQLKTVFNFDLSVAPGAISGLLAVAGGPNEIDLSWTLSSPNNARGITVEQSTDGGTTWTTIATLAANASTASMTGLDATQSYEFRLSTTNGAGTSSSVSTGSSLKPLPAPRFAVIDLGTNNVPIKVTASGYVLMQSTTGTVTSYSRWYEGTNTVLTAGTSAFTVPTSLPPGWTDFGYNDSYINPSSQPSQVMATDITETGTVVGAQDWEWIEFGHYFWDYGPDGEGPYPTGDSFYTYGYMCRATWAASSSTANTVTVSYAGDYRVPGLFGSSGVDGTSGWAADGPLVVSGGSAVYSIEGIPAPTAGIPEAMLDLFKDGVDQSKTADALIGTDTSGDVVYSSKGTNYFNATIIPNTFLPVMVSNTNSVSGASIAGTTGSPSHAAWWDSSGVHTIDGNAGTWITAMNAATTSVGGTTINARQVLGWDSAGTRMLWEMNTNGTFNPPLKLNDLVATNSGWSDIAPSQGGGENINISPLSDNGAIVGTATYTPTGTTDPIAAGSHGVLLMPLIIDKVWSNQNGGLGDMSNNNYFTNQNSNGTGVAAYPFITMGFGSDGLAHVKAHITMPNMPYLANKLLVRLAIQPGGSGTAITPVGSGTFDSSTNIATLTYDGANSSDNGATDWLIVAGIDTNGDEVLQASEIAAQATDKIRAITSTAYNTDLAFLILGENTIGRFIQPNAGDFLRAFVNDEAVDGATATTTTIQVNATTPQPLSVNVGALFQPNGAGSIRNNVFPADGILAIDIESSATFHAYVTNILDSHHAEVDAYFAANPTSAPHQFGPWTGPTALALTDDDLIDALDNVTANLTVTVTVANTKVAQSIATTGTISDLYDFTWPDTRTGDGSIAQNTLISGISVQAGYNTLGSGGHIFTSLVNINALGDISAGFNYTFQ